jgi:hypothetical protein
MQTTITPLLLPVIFHCHNHLSIYAVPFLQVSSFYIFFNFTFGTEIGLKLSVIMAALKKAKPEQKNLADKDYNASSTKYKIDS